VEDIPLLSWAAVSNRAAVVKVLLQAGADPEAKDKYQWTPVQHARGVDHDRPAVETLLRPAIEAKKQQQSQVSKNSAQQ
jgi:ankyrin repeat protein